jgi:hypothetical protein
MLRFLWDCFICGKASVLDHPTPDQLSHLRPVFIYQLIEKSKKHHGKALNSSMVGITA